MYPKMSEAQQLKVMKTNHPSQARAIIGNKMRSKP